MGNTVFFVWQSDTPASVGRELISDALQEAIDHLNADTSCRYPLWLDSDTQGLPGYPRLLDEILRKIEQSAVCVVDLTIIGKSVHRETPFPNPNVMFELGFALARLSDKAIVPVMNTTYGKADQLPADIRDRRWPIEFEASPDQDAERRASIVSNLATRFVSELRNCVTAAPRRLNVKPSHVLHPIPSTGGRIHISAVNPHGEVVGWAYRLDRLHDPFRWTREDGFQAIPIPQPFVRGIADDIDSHGRVVGRMVGPKGCVGFQQSSRDADVELLEWMNQLGSNPLVTDDRGRIADSVSGWVWSPTEKMRVIQPSRQQGPSRVWIHGFGPTGLIFGVEHTNNGGYGCVWTEGMQLVDPVGIVPAGTGHISRILDVSASGECLAVLQQLSNHGERLCVGRIGEAFDVLPLAGCRVGAICDDNSIVSEHGIWSRNLGLRNIIELAVDSSSWSGLQITAVNCHGMLGGHGMRDFAHTGFLAVPTDGMIAFES